MRGISVGRYVGVAILAASVVCIQPRAGYAASDAWITTKAKIALLTTAGVKDLSITADAKMRLLADPDVPALDVNVDTYNGAVTLWGAVPTPRAKTAAEADVRKISGVTRVVNELQVVPVARKEEVKARDQDLKDQVTKAIRARDDLKGASIDVDVKNGVARLTGTVDGEQQRLVAAIVARSTPGVRAVQNDTRVNVAAR